MATFRERYLLAMQRAGKRSTDISRDLGIPESTLSQYKKGKYEPKQQRVDALARYLHVSVTWLMGFDEKPLPPNVEPMPEMRQVPLVGQIACGEPLLAEENIEELVDIPAHIHADFALRCKGDSMINARIFDGDIVYIRQQPMVEDGEIAAVRVDDVATLKRVRLFPDHVVLEAENPQYKPLVFWNEAMNELDIVGKAVAFTSAIKRE